MAKKQRIDNPYSDGDFTEYDLESGESEHFVKYDGYLSEGYIGSNGSKRIIDKSTGDVSVRNQNGETETFHRDLFGGRNYRSDQGTSIEQHLFDDGFRVTDPDGKRTDINVYQNPGGSTTYQSSHGGSYTFDRPHGPEDSKGIKNPPQKPEPEPYSVNTYYASPFGVFPTLNLWIYLGILLYCILASIFKVLPRPEVLCHLLLVIGAVQFAAGCGMEQYVSFYEYFILGSALWLVTQVCHTLIYAYPRNPAHYTDHFWSAGFKYSAAAYVIGLVFFFLGKAGILNKILSVLPIGNRK